MRPILPVLLAHGREDLAVRLLEDLRRRGRASSDDLQRLGLLREKDGQLAEARVRLEEAAQGRPDSVPLLLDLARVAQKARDLQGALGYLAHARALEPGNARVHFLFGMVCVELDLGGGGLQLPEGGGPARPGERRRQLRHGRGRPPPQGRLRGHPLLPQVLGARARTSPAGRSRSAWPPSRPRTSRPPRALLRPAAERPATAAAANYFLARMARAENEFEEALRLALRAVEADPAYADPYSELGLLYLRLGQPEKAEQALRRCLEIDPEHYLGNLHLTMLYAQTRDPREPEQRQRFDEIKKRRAEKAADFLRPIEVRPY